MADVKNEEIMLKKAVIELHHTKSVPNLLFLRNQHTDFTSFTSFRALNVC